MIDYKCIYSIIPTLFVAAHPNPMQKTSSYMEDYNWSSGVFIILM